MAAHASRPVVKEIHGRGRALVASEHISPGQIILQESPIIVYFNASSHASPSSYCAHCFRRIALASQSFPCPSCSEHAIFCSPLCRSTAVASSHSPWVCETLARLRLSPPLNSDLLTQAYFLIASFNLSVISPSDFQCLLSLQGAAPPNPDALTLHSLLSSLSPNFYAFSHELVSSLLAKDKLNAFSLMEPFDGSGVRSARAYAIYPSSSFFNHDCLPNACRFDYLDGSGSRNTDVIVRAIHDIPQGREVCLCYFPVNWVYKDRQRLLMEEYGFICECDRCTVEKNWEDEGCGDENFEATNDEEMEDREDGDDEDFPHAYFFVRYLCDGENCGGTMAPLPPSQGAHSNVLECNVCGLLKRDVGFDQDDGEEKCHRRSLWMDACCMIME